MIQKTSNIEHYSSRANSITQGMVSIILLNWNGKRFLTDCIHSLHTQSYQNVELLIIDNCSTDGSRELLQGQYLEHRLLFTKKNLGYCGGANLGIRNTSGEYILVLNPDIMLSADFLAHLVKKAEETRQIGILTGKLLRFDKQTLDSTGQFLRKNFSPLERGYGERDNGQYEQPGFVFSACGGAAFYRRAMLEDIQIEGKYFDETYFAYYEDLDLGWRAQLFGWKAYYEPKALAYHYRGGGLSEEPCKQSWIERLPWVPKVSFFQKPAFIQRHIIVNRYLTILKNASWSDILMGLPAILKFEVLLWGYVLCGRPSLFTTLIDLIALVPKALKKRRDIQARKISTI